MFNTEIRKTSVKEALQLKILKICATDLSLITQVTFGVDMRASFLRAMLICEVGRSGSIAQLVLSLIIPVEFD